jgi:hypothetical protein
VHIFPPGPQHFAHPWVVTRCFWWSCHLSLDGGSDQVRQTRVSPSRTSSLGSERFAGLPPPPHSRCMWVSLFRTKGNEWVTCRAQCYFILNASPARPIYYNVDRVRDGRSYVTRAVRAVQNGRTVFIMVCSYQKPEHWQPSYRSPMPPNVRAPEGCKEVAILCREQAAATENEDLKKTWTTRAEVFVLCGYNF